VKSPIIFFLGDEELGWTDDGMDDETDGWKGRPPRILNKQINGMAAGHYTLDLRGRLHS
jgi:hypothetical protein